MFAMDSSERLRGEVPFELQRWALTCKLLGVNDETIAKESEGRLTLEQLRVLGRSLEGDPLHAAAADLVMLLKRHEWLADVRRQVELVGRWGTRVERRKTPPAKVFFDEYFATNRPVVLTDFGKAWPAKKKWTNAYLRRTCGDATVKVVHNREKTHLYDAKAKALSRELRFSDFIDWVEAHPTSNDRYLVGNNDALSNPLVATLLKDCPYDTTYFDPRRVEGCAYLWFGPGGTVTPLHHDTVNIILTQVRGTKHFTLISPAHTALLHDSHAYYSLLTGSEEPPVAAEREHRRVHGRPGRVGVHSGGVVAPRQVGVGQHLADAHQLPRAQRLRGDEPHRDAMEDVTGPCGAGFKGPTTTPSVFL